MLIEYGVHRDDNKKFLITSVGGHWDQAAVKNGCEDLRSENVVGTMLESHISSDDTRMWIETMILSSVLTKKILNKTYRCDTPKLCRTFSLLIDPQNNRDAILRHELIQQNHMNANITISSAINRDS